MIRHNGHSGRLRVRFRREKSKLQFAATSKLALRAGTISKPRPLRLDARAVGFVYWPNDIIP